MLHCELLQLPHSIGRGYGWCGMPGIGVCVCVCVCARVHEVGKMAKDIGMTIRKGIVVSFLPCLVAFWGFGDLFLGGGERYEWCLDGVVVWDR